MRILAIRGENLASLGQPFVIDFEAEPLAARPDPASRQSSMRFALHSTGAIHVLLRPSKTLHLTQEARSRYWMEARSFGAAPAKDMPRSTLSARTICVIAPDGTLVEPKKGIPFEAAAEELIQFLPNRCVEELGLDGDLGLD